MPAALPTTPRSTSSTINTLQKEDAPVHGWYRFILSYPPHLVRRYVETFGVGRTGLIFDPFCGTGTTLVEAKKMGIPSVGCDAHPFAILASQVKTAWTLQTAELRRELRRILREAEAATQESGLESLSFDTALVSEDPPDFLQNVLTEDEARLIPTGFLSARPLGRLLLLRRAIKCSNGPMRDFFRLALAHVIANGAGNFAFGPEIYRTKAKSDYDVLGHFARHADTMISELQTQQESGLADVPSRVIAADARELQNVPDGLSAVITSPPYPNEKDYTRTTRVEIILL